MPEELSKYLRESEERYRTLVDAASDAILGVDENFTIIFANPAVENIFGYKVFELAGKHLSVLFPAATVENHLKNLIPGASEHSKILTERIEIPALRQSGEIFPLEISFAKCQQYGKLCFIAIARDIAERKYTEEVLRESQMMLTLAMRSSRIGAWERDISTDTVNWSPELEEIFGFNIGDFNRNIDSFYELVHKDDRERIHFEILRAIAEKREYQIEFRFYHKDGTVRWMEGRGQAIYSQNGEPVRVYGIGIDITERKNAEEINDRYRLLSSRARDIILFVGADGGIVDANQAAVNTYGYDYRTLLRMNITDLRAPETLNLLQDQLLNAIDAGVHFETVHRRRDGSTFPVEVNSIGANVGDARLLMSIIRDITERKNAELEREKLLALEQAARADAESANRAKDEFLSVLSHELRTPLNSILGWTTMFKTGALNQAQVNQAIETIERNARIQNNLIEDLLDVSRIISGKMRIDTERINLSSTASAAIETVRPLAVSKNVTLTIENTDIDLEINGDATRIQQIVVNLVNNAVKFTAPGGFVSVVLFKKEKMARLQINDTGIGINPDFLPHIFDRFSQADSTTKRNHSGLGLGLTIVRHLTEMHGGEVFVESAGEGKGSSFAVEFPLIPNPFFSEEFSPVNNDSAFNQELFKNILPGKRILLIDDDCDGVYPIKLFLEKHGADVTCIESAAEALKQIEAKRFDLILSDIGMPEIDGYQLIEHIRSGTSNPDVPAIALTAYASSEDRRKAVESGFQTHISKPINFEKLLRAIIGALGAGENKIEKQTELQNEIS